MEVRDRPAMADWAEENYVLSQETSELAGPWSNDYTPYLVPIMSCLDDITTRQVTNFWLGLSEVYLSQTIA